MTAAGVSAGSLRTGSVGDGWRRPADPLLHDDVTAAPARPDAAVLAFAVIGLRWGSSWAGPISGAA